MEKSKLIKIFLVIAVSLMLVFTATSTFAADNTTNFIDVTNSSSSNSNTGNTNSNTNSNTAGNTNSNSNASSISNTTNTTTNNTTSSSNYNTNNTNTNLPKTGVAETGSVVCVVFALAVSAVYAYKKLRDYNI